MTPKKFSRPYTPSTKREQFTTRIKFQKNSNNMANSKLLQPFILRWKAGLKRPARPRRATNKGITISTFRQFYGKDATVEQLKSITNEQWLTIFKAGYWNPWCADEIAKPIHREYRRRLGMGVWYKNVHQAGAAHPQRHRRWHRWAEDSRGHQLGESP